MLYFKTVGGKRPRSQQNTRQGELITAERCFWHDPIPDLDNANVGIVDTWWTLRVEALRHMLMILDKRHRIRWRFFITKKVRPSGKIT